MYIEIKLTEPSIVNQFCELIQGYGREDLTLVASFDKTRLKTFEMNSWCDDLCIEIRNTSVLHPKYHLLIRGESPVS